MPFSLTPVALLRHKRDPMLGSRLLEWRVVEIVARSTLMKHYLAVRLSEQTGKRAAYASRLFKTSSSFFSCCFNHLPFSTEAHFDRLKFILPKYRKLIIRDLQDMLLSDVLDFLNTYKTFRTQ